MEEVLEIDGQISGRGTRTWLYHGTMFSLSVLFTYPLRRKRRQKDRQAFSSAKRGKNYYVDYVQNTAALCIP